MKGKIEPRADREQMEARIQALSANERGSARPVGGGSQLEDGRNGCPREWIINGCYWCGTDVCVNPKWVGAKCDNCGGHFLVSR